VAFSVLYGGLKGRSQIGLNYWILKGRTAKYLSLFLYSLFWSVGFSELQSCAALFGASLFGALSQIVRKTRKEEKDVMANSIGVSRFRRFVFWCKRVFILESGRIRQVKTGSCSARAKNIIRFYYLDARYFGSLVFCIMFGWSMQCLCSSEFFCLMDNILLGKLASYLSSFKCVLWYPQQTPHVGAV